MSFFGSTIVAALVAEPTDGEKVDVTGVVDVGVPIAALLLLNKFD